MYKKSLLIYLTAFVFLIFSYRKTGASEIFDAINKGDALKVRELLVQDPGLIEKTNNLGETPLHTCSSLGYSEIEELLIENGADINAENNDGKTLLHIAAQSGRNEIVELLIEKGAKNE